MNELSVKLKCVLMKNGVMLWVEESKAITLQGVLDNLTSHMFIRFNGRSINTAELNGVYEASDIEDMTRRKNGQWQCPSGSWHERNEKCGCITSGEARKNRERDEAIRACGKCVGGWIVDDSRKGARICECQKPFEPQN